MADENFYTVKDMICRIEKKLDLLVDRQVEIKNEQTRHVATTTAALNSLKEDIQEAVKLINAHDISIRAHDNALTKITAYATIAASAITFFANRFI